MRTRRMQVHVGCSNGPIRLRGAQQHFYLLDSVDWQRGKSRDVVPIFALTNLQFLFLVIWAEQKIPEFLIVNLHTSALELNFPSSPFASHIEELLEGSGVNTRIVLRPLHRVRLAGASLTIREHTNIVAIQHGDYQIANSAEKVCLTRVLAIDLVELEGLLLAHVCIADLDLIWPRKRDTAAMGSLCFRHGPHAAVDPDVAFELLHQVVQLASALAFH
mmetsp:Transcript_48567/g.113365  ORF Transcript_48567/g.113365 Transcript_48567/m.113365 type:complete len:218 (-) Transcript_48567:1167-1820(-)